MAIIGKARKVRVTAADTFISGPQGAANDISDRVEQIKNEIKSSANERALMILKV